MASGLLTVNSSSACISGEQFAYFDLFNAVISVIFGAAFCECV